VAYNEKTNWTDSDSLDAVDLNRIEQGIADVDDTLTTYMAGSDARLDNYMATKGIPVFRSFTNGTTPAITPGTLWGERAAGASATPVATLVSHQGSTTDQADYVFTPELTMGPAALYIAFVFSGMLATGATAAVMPNTMTGRSVTWTKVGTGATSANTFTGCQIFKGIGTPAASGALTISYPSTSPQQGCHLILVGVTNVSTIAAANAYNGASTSLTAPTVALASAPAAGTVQLLGIGLQNSTATITTDPGTPFVPSGGSADVSTSSPSVLTRASFRSTAQQTNTWAQTGSVQYIAATVTLTAA